MPLTRCLEETTHRQYLAWQEWLDRQWNEPSRHDHYLMQIAHEVCRGNVKNPTLLRMEQFKLEFREAGSSSKPMTREQAAAISKAKWLSIVGMKPEIRTVPPEGA